MCTRSLFLQFRKSCHFSKGLRDEDRARRKAALLQCGQISQAYVIQPCCLCALEKCIACCEYLH